MNNKVALLSTDNLENFFTYDKLLFEPSFAVNLKMKVPELSLYF